MACQAVPSNHHQPGRAHPSTTIAAQLKCTSKVPLDDQGCFLKAPFAKVCGCAVGWRCAAMPKLLRQLQRAEAQLGGTHGSSSGSLICCTYSSATSMPAVNNSSKHLRLPWLKGIAAAANMAIRITGMYPSFTACLTVQVGGALTATG